MFNTKGRRIVDQIWYSIILLSSHLHSAVPCRHVPHEHSQASVQVDLMKLSGLFTQTHLGNLLGRNKIVSGKNSFLWVRELRLVLVFFVFVFGGLQGGIWVLSWYFCIGPPGRDRLWGVRLYTLGQLLLVWSGPRFNWMQILTRPGNRGYGDGDDFLMWGNI